MDDSSTSRVLLIRHGETHGYFDDVGLTDKGEAQATAKARELAATLPAGARVVMPHAPTARGTATAATLRAVLLDELGPDTDVEVGALEPDGRFDSLQFLHDGQARESSGVARDRLALAGERPDWVKAFDRFDSDFYDSDKLAGPIERWMVSTDLFFEPTQVAVYRLWAGVRAQAPGTITLASSHSGPMRAFATAALGHDPGEPENLEHIDVVVEGPRATVTFRDEQVVLDVPPVVPPWLNPAYLQGDRTARPW